MPAVHGAVGGAVAPASLAPNPELESGLQAIELALSQIDSAFANGDPELVARSAQALHDALSHAMALAQMVKQSGQAWVLPVEVTQRLSVARARVRAHQQAVMRGRVAAERALSVLIEREPDNTYAALGGAQPGRSGRYR